MPEDLDYCYQNNRTMLLLYFPQGVGSSAAPHAIWELSGARRKEGFDFIGLDSHERKNHLKPIFPLFQMTGCR
jgi:hypothetical protein